MKTEIISFRKLVMLGFYVVLIFSLLAIIRKQSHNLISKDGNDTSVHNTTIGNAVV